MFLLKSLKLKKCLNKKELNAMKNEIEGYKIRKWYEFFEETKNKAYELFLS